MLAGEILISAGSITIFQLKPLPLSVAAELPIFPFPRASGAVPTRQPPRALPQRPADPAAPPGLGWQLLHHTGGHGVSGPEASKRVAGSGPRNRT